VSTTRAFAIVPARTNATLREPPSHPARAP
jgi:hypothetical protein